MLRTECLYIGPLYSIAVLFDNDKSEVAEFIESLLEADKASLTVLIDHILEIGPPHNTEKFRNEGEGIYSLKTKNVRIYGFFDGTKVLTLAIGFMKNAGGPKVERRLHKRAVELKENLFRERRSS